MALYAASAPPDPCGTLFTLKHPSLISSWFHHRAWRWIIFRASHVQCLLAGLLGWWLITWLLFLPWATTIDEPFWGNQGVLSALTSSARHAIMPAFYTASVFIIVPTFIIAALVHDRHARTVIKDTKWRTRAWFAAPWMLLPFVVPPLLWLWLGFARSLTLDDMSVVPPAIVWRGFDTFFMPALLSVALLLAIKVAILIAAIVITQLNWRDRLITRHECHKCAYDISTLPKGATCPECGTPSPPWPPLEPTTRAIRPPDA